MPHRIPLFKIPIAPNLLTLMDCYWITAIFVYVMSIVQYIMFSVDIVVKTQEKNEIRVCIILILSEKNIWLNNNGR